MIKQLRRSSNLYQRLDLNLAFYSYDKSLHYVSCQLEPTASFVYLSLCNANNYSAPLHLLIWTILMKNSHVCIALEVPHWQPQALASPALFVALRCRLSNAMCCSNCAGGESSEAWEVWSTSQDYFAGWTLDSRVWACDCRTKAEEGAAKDQIQRWSEQALSLTSYYDFWDPFVILRVDAHSFVILRVTNILDVFAVSSEPSQLHTSPKLERCFLLHVAKSCKYNFYLDEFHEEDKI